MIHDTHELPDTCTEIQGMYYCTSNICYMQRIHKEATKQDDYDVSCLLNTAKNESFFEGLSYLPRKMPGEF